MPHYRKITEYPDYDLDWAHKKYTGKQRKRKKEKQIKYKKKRKRYSPKKKKVRGALKKELIRKEKKEFPLGRRMESRRDVPPYRQVVYPKDLEELMHLSPRGACQHMLKIRKKLGKQRGEIVTLREFCDNSPFERNDLIPYLLD